MKLALLASALLLLSAGRVFASTLPGHLKCTNKAHTKVFRLLRLQGGDKLQAVLIDGRGSEPITLNVRQLTRASDAYPFKEATGYYAEGNLRVAVIDHSLKRSIPGKIWDEEMICERFELVRYLP